MVTVFVLEEQKEDKHKKTQQLFVCSCITFLTEIAFGPLLSLFFILLCLFVYLCACVGVCLLIMSQNTEQHSTRFTKHISLPQRGT